MDPLNQHPVSQALEPEQTFSITKQHDLKKLALITAIVCAIIFIVNIPIAVITALPSAGITCFVSAVICGAALGIHQSELFKTSHHVQCTQQSYIEEIN